MKARIAGKDEYLSPEQAREVTDQRADLFGAELSWLS